VLLALRRFESMWRRENTKAQLRPAFTTICAILWLAATTVLGLIPPRAIAQSPGPSATGQATASAAPNPGEAGPPLADSQEIIAYLSNVISWYRHLSVEEQLVTEPSETLLFADDKQTANQVLDLAFEYARAQAANLAKTIGHNGISSGAAVHARPGAPDFSAMRKRSDELQAEADSLQARIHDLQSHLNATTGTRQRKQIESQVAAAQGALDLTQARIGAIGAIMNFGMGSAAPERSGGLLGKIDELEASIPESERSLPHQATEAAAAQPTGIFGLAADLFELRRKIDTLDDTADLARDLSARIAAARKPLSDAMHGIDARGNQFAQAPDSDDAGTLRDRKHAFEALLDEHKLVAAAMIPLSKQAALLEHYQDNLAQWRASAEQRTTEDLRLLTIRLIALGSVFALIFLGAILWRRLTNRYVTDFRLRGQVMAARRFAIVLIVVAVILINFSSALGSAATVMGFAAAGIALALQNVILSIAGYFFLIGRFGIRVGDRVEISGTTGDVIDIGLVKLSLMELGGVGVARQPTGRVVVFSNAIVFQPNGHFFKQAPGASFIWNEVRLTLSPDCDYHLAEKRLVEAVESVFSRYRDQVDRDWRALQLELNMILESPKPQSLMNLGPSGLTVIVRYPAETYNAPKIADEVTRRVLEAIDREPGLRLAMKDAANIQAQPVTPGAGDPRSSA